MDTYKKTAVREMFHTPFKKTFNKINVELRHAEVETSSWEHKYNGQRVTAYYQIPTAITTATISVTKNSSRPATASSEFFQ